MSRVIAIVGLSCRYPDACTPRRLWENVLSQRRAFRRLPAERLRLADYFSANGEAPDSTYSTEAALIEGYEFDRVRFRIGSRAFRSADLTHWLALDVASQALEDAGFRGGEGLPRDGTGVLLGNSLTGEFSRAGLMRLRWPYVRRQVAAALAGEGWDGAARGRFLARLETSYKEPFPETTEETLAGGLSNTIAGRICNYYDLHGGGYTVDGACASSLLAVATACSALAAGDLEVALAGGVDLSLDPFELVGFARTRALAAGDMRVYDQRSAGFLPGEGCGFAVLMRHADAIAQGRRIYALIRGWGISSDGGGGLTRPEVEGQLHALRRAYRRAGFGIDSVAFFEGHGTGTAVGDATELATLNRARREASPSGQARAAIGSIKANIGHTKAAAGAASLIKATLALHHQVLPPTTGCHDPHRELTGGESTLRVLRRAELWPARTPLRAGVSAMGFGGINCHVVLESAAARRRRAWTSRERPLIAGPQDAELLVLAAASAEEMAARVDRLERLAGRLSRAEVGDLAAALARELPARTSLRAALVAAGPEELKSRLATLHGWLQSRAADRLDAAGGVFLGRATTPPRVGFLFPGQGSPVRLGDGVWRRRFAAVDALGARIAVPDSADGTATSVAQPALCAACLAGLAVCEKLRIEAAVAVGHSLGELVAYHWAGAFAADALLRIATRRGRAMAECDRPGAMASLGAGAADVERLLEGLDSGTLVVTGLNSPRQTVISGEIPAVDEVAARAQDRGWSVTRLPVSHAFHSPLVAAAAPRLATALAAEDVAPLRRRVASTVTGAWLEAETDLRGLLERQVTSPVRFIAALETAAAEADLFLEVGPGEVLSGLARQVVAVPVLPLDAGGPSLRGLLNAAGALFALGAPVAPAELFGDRFTRPFDVDRELRFLANPCERAPLGDGGGEPRAAIAELAAAAPPMPVPGVREDGSPQEVVRQLIARRTELPPASVAGESRLLSDLHLSSIAVGEIVTEAARRLGLPPPAAPTEYANVTVEEVARTLEELAKTGTAEPSAGAEILPPGIGSWVRPFTVERVARPRRRRLSELRETSRPWQLFTPAEHPFRPALERACGQVGGGGVVIYLPPAADERFLDLLLRAGRAALQDRQAPFVLVHHGGGAAGFARTFHLESPAAPVTVVELPAPLPASDLGTWSERVAAEIGLGGGYSEACYDAAGRRFQPVLRPLPAAPETAAPPLAANGVVLVSGGGKGIGAECALDLARRFGARLALLGRSRPESDAELAANLERFAARGAVFRYLQADVTDPASVRAAVERAEAELGPVRAILHSAGANVPKLLTALERGDFAKTLAPKVEGLRNLLDAVDRGRLELVVGFGSIIARTGLAGEADYALANEWLRRALEELARELPRCRCLCVEWSVWEGVGMGARLGRLEALVRQGITAIPPQRGVEILADLLARPTPVAVVVTGRCGQLSTLEVERPELPLLRFLERPRVFFPGVELVADSTLSSATDPYLADHVFDGEQLFPAVMGLEAMAQAWRALTGESRPPELGDVRFERPISVPRGESVTLRLAALARRSGRIEVVLRSGRTAFQIDHFRAVLSPGEAAESGPAPSPPAADEAAGAFLPLEPRRDLYGRILFQDGRFQRLRGYRKLCATACLMEISAAGGAGWFSPFLPAELLLGDPGMRDASLHGIQACIPHATVLPAAVKRWRVLAASSGPWSVAAHERSRQGRTLIFDLEVRDRRGMPVERWEGLELRVVTAPSAALVLAPPLLGPYLERRLHDLLPEASLAVVVERNGQPQRRGRGDRALRQILGHDAVLHRRPDGKPEATAAGEAAAEPGISVAHSGDLVVAVAGRGAVGCDIEPVAARSERVWHDLLGRARADLLDVVVRETGEGRDAAATRIWTVLESSRKAGRGADAPLVFSAVRDEWVFFASGRHLAATVLLPQAGSELPLSFAVMVRRAGQEGGPQEDPSP